ncbi:unnamed protein product [Paramecium primaurelia]|uniref:Protein kinase domain-containing protein n=1 Tax=Paramecium primaurelia TaxID=5886 RepID=A0A8S1NL15_PARPR|nr:unnamed protein product [Paramecium primaurelia]
MKDVFGCYKIHLDKKINQGSQANIYECTNTDSNSRCCARVIQKRNDNYQTDQQSYMRELQVLEQLKWIRHDNILAIYDYKEEENYIYQFCDICDGTLLDFKKGQNITRKDFLDLIQQISSGYLILKKNKIIHRDFKPENILIKKKGDQIQYKIADFGMSKLFDDKTRINTNMVGTQQYCSPEMLSLTNYSYESDIFSFGIILFEKAAGNLDLYNDKKKQKKLLEALKTQSFKQYIQNNLIENQIQEYILDILDKLIVQDSQKRMTWEQLNSLATNQLDEFHSFFQPISDFRQRGTVSLYQISSKTEPSSNENLTINKNLKDSQLKTLNIQANSDQFKILPQQHFPQFFKQNQICKQKQLINPIFGYSTLNKEAQKFDFNNQNQQYSNQNQKEKQIIQQSFDFTNIQNVNPNLFDKKQQTFQNGK